MEHATQNTKVKHRVDVKQLVVLALLSAMGFISLFLVDIPVYGFLSYEPKDIFITLGGFLYGPMATVCMSVVISFLEFVTISTTGPIGFIMNALATCAFCCTASFIYKKMHTKKGAVLGLACGVVALTAVMLLWNYLITPLYMTGFSRADVAAMLPTLFLPFNLAKGGMNMAATLLIYPPVVAALRGAGVVPPSQSTQAKKISAGFVLFSLALLATFVVFALVLAGVI